MPQPPSFPLSFSHTLTCRARKGLEGMLNHLLRAQILKLLIVLLKIGLAGLCAGANGLGDILIVSP